MDPSADQPAPTTDPAQLPALLQQLVRDLADPAITYLLGATTTTARTTRATGTFLPCLPCGRER